MLDGIEVTRYCYIGVVVRPAARTTSRSATCTSTTTDSTSARRAARESTSRQTSNVLIENNLVTDNVPRSRTSGSGIDVQRSRSGDRSQQRGRSQQRQRDPGRGRHERARRGQPARYNVGDFSGWGTSGIWLDGGHDVTLRNNWLEGNVWDGLQITDEDLQRPLRLRDLQQRRDRQLVRDAARRRRPGRRAAQPDLRQQLRRQHGRRRQPDRPQLQPAHPHARCTATWWPRSDVDQPALQVDQGTYPDVALDDNLYYRQGSGKPISWGYSFGKSYDTDAALGRGSKTFAEYQALSGWDASSISADPLFVERGRRRLPPARGQPRARRRLGAATRRPTTTTVTPRPRARVRTSVRSREAGPAPPAPASRARPPRPRSTRPCCRSSPCRYDPVGRGVGDQELRRQRPQRRYVKPRDPLGHRMQLLASDGSCPAGTVSGVPGFRVEPARAGVVGLHGGRAARCRRRSS